MVTTRRPNLHAALLERLGTPTALALNENLYATAYHPLQEGKATSLNIWQEVLALGEPLPTLPFWLRAGLCLPIELETTYERTRQEQRVGTNGA